MTDIFSATSQFILWSGIYLSTRFPWSGAITLAIFGPITAFIAWDLFFPIEVTVQTSIGHPLNMTLRLATLLVISLYLFDSIRKSWSTQASTHGS